MANNMYARVGECKPDNLTGDNLVFQKRVEVVLPAGTFERGQLLVIDADMAASMPTATTVEVDGILLDDIGEITVATPAAVSLTGEFNENMVLWGEITDANKPAVKKAAAEKQLYIAPMAKAPFVQFGEVI